jgi:hypothetical protein
MDEQRKDLIVLLINSTTTSIDAIRRMRQEIVLLGAAVSQPM